MNRRDFLNISIRGMVAYCILCLESYVLEAYADRNLAPVLRLAWGIVGPDRHIDENAYRYMEAVNLVFDVVVCLREHRIQLPDFGLVRGFSFDELHSWVVHISSEGLSRIIQPAREVRKTPRAEQGSRQ